MEFSQREIKRANGPYSLVWMRRSLRGWLHGCKPWESLLYEPAMKKIKENLSNDSKYFESLIQKYLLDNQHRALVIIEPKEEFLPEQEARLAKELSDEEKFLSWSEKQKIIDRSAELEKMQSEADSIDALAAIPHLSRNDLSHEPEMIPRRLLDLQGIPALSHELFTNGISYFIIAFPLDLLPLDDYQWLPFFSRAVVSVGLPGMDYGEVSSLFARNTGGFNAILLSNSAVPGSPQNIVTPSGLMDIKGRDWITYRLKCLDEKISPSLDLALRMICEADFSDHRRINDLVLEMKSEMDSSLAPAGHMYASGRSGRQNSRTKQIEEIWHGISQIDFVHKLSRMDTPLIADKLRDLRERIADAGVIVNVTGNVLDTACSELARRFSRFGIPKPRLLYNFPSVVNVPEVFASVSLQVGFAAQTFNTAPYDTREQAAEFVLAHQLSTGALWEDIRMKGGAYGAFVNTDSLENCFTFATYRDPVPQRSLDIFKSIINNDRFEKCTEDLLVKSIIGCYAKETTPRTSAEKGTLDFIRFLCGIEDGHRKRRLERLVSVTAEDINNAFKSLVSKKLSGQVIISGVKDAERAAKALGVELKMLPV
jgi:Zn-dependent M16 (insulinase) family peptidase